MKQEIYSPSVHISNETNVLPQLLGRIKLSNFISLSEDKFRDFVKEIEENEVFKKLTYPEDKEIKIVSYKRYPNTAFNNRFCELKEEITSDSTNMNIQKILAENTEIIGVIKTIGMENFKKYFISCDSELGLNEISDICGLTVDETKKIIEFVNSVFVMEDFYNPNQITAGKKFNPEFKCVAKIKQAAGKDKKCLIEFINLNYLRGRYAINYRKLSELKAVNKFGKKELAEINRLIKKLELVNARKTILYQIIASIVQKQSKYFKTGKISDLKSYTQRMVAKELSVSPGSISRVLNHKSVETSWGEEKPLRYLLPNEKHTRKELIRNIFLKEKTKSDRVIAEKIKQKYGFSIARRTVCQYRKELSKYLP